MITTDITKNIARYVRENNINMADISRETGIVYPILYASLGNGNRGRKLSVDEGYLVCKHLGMKVEDFADSEIQGRGDSAYAE